MVCTPLGSLGFSWCILLLVNICFQVPGDVPSTSAVAVPSTSAAAVLPDKKQWVEAKSSEAVRIAKEKVRSVAALKNPNDSLILAYLDELSAVATV